MKLKSNTNKVLMKTLFLLFSFASSNIQAAGTVTVSNEKQNILNKDVFSVNSQFSDGRIDYAHPELSQVYNKTGSQVIRYPGGTFANFYNPNTGFFDTNYPGMSDHHKNQTQGFNAKARAANPTDGYNVDDFEIFANETNTAVSLVLNVSTRTPQQSEDFLRDLFNRGINVEYVEFGNELYFGIYDGLIKDGPDYVATAREHAKKVDNIFPNAKKGLVITSHAYTSASFVDAAEDPNSSNKYVNWNNSVKEAANNNSFFDAVIIHLYSDLGDEAKSNIPVDQLPPYTTTYLSTISHTDVQLEKTMDYLKDLYPNKKVWVTEWHVGGWGGTLRQYRLRHSYLGGLYANNFFLEMLKYPQVTMSSRHSFKQMVKLAPTSIGGSVADNFHSVEVQNIAKLDMMAMFKGAVLNNKYYASGSLSSMAGYKGTGDYNQSGLPDVNVGLFYNEHNDKGQVFLINKLNKSYQIDKVALSNGTASITDVTLYTHPNTSNGLTQEDTLVTKNISYSAGNAISIPAYSTVKLDIDITGAGDNGGDTETKILLQENFEGGWGIFKSNGSNASIYTGSKAAQGSKAALLRASTGSTASIQAINGFDATPYSEISFNFSFYADTNSGTVRVQCFTGAGWVTLATYHAGSDYQNGSFTTKSITMSANNYAFSKDMKFKFVSVASGGTGDDVYVDDIKLTTEVEVETPDIPDIPDTGTALLTDNFENGWGNFKSNGSNASLYTGSKASQGSKAALLRASTGSTASIVTVNGRDATPYSAVTLNFTLYANTNGGKVRVQCSTDSGWVTLATYQSGSDYINNGFTAKSITIPSSKYTLSNDMKFKFVSVASGGTGDDIYIDDIKVTH